VSVAGIAELLASASAAHRSGVASELGLAPEAPAEEIGTVLRDPERIASIVAGLSPRALRLAAQAAFLGESTVHESWNGRPSDAASELERHGLAFAFKPSFVVEYRVPRELHPLLADALAAPYASGLASARPARWLGAPLALAHDMATLWAYLARSPVRIKTDGVVYQRDVPKLFDALPPLELHGPQQPMEGPRLGFVLALLRDEKLVRIRVNDGPGGDGRRELVPAGDPAALFDMDPERLRARLAGHACRSLLGAPALALANALEPGATVKLTSFGAALRALCEETGVGVPQAADFGLALGGLHFAWLAGAVILGLESNGMPTALRAEPAVIPTRGRVVAQANFELIALSPPSPSERLVLALACEPVPEQAHVFRLTRKSVCAAQRSGMLDGGVTVALERLAGELPQNVTRSLADWTSSVRAPLRLRTALILDAGDSGTADALLGGELAAHVVERLGPTQLAIPAAEVKAVAAALRRAGHDLDPGIDRVSGRFSEREPVRTEAEQTWEPDPIDEAPDVKQVSTLPQAARQPASQRSNVPLRYDAEEAQDPVEVVLDAIERGTDVFIVYAGARGTTQRQITPYEVEGAAVHAHCHLRGDERLFWLASIQDAVALD
jgi:hypothetical protein